MLTVVASAISTARRRHPPHGGPLQKFAAAQASILKHLNHDRHLNRRDISKQNLGAALAEWRQLAA